MANRRMFSKSIVRTDDFTEMPQTAQNLYFHLGVEADDDGFITPKMVMKTLGSSGDDLKVLIGKGFIVPFESGVIVLRHWKENNYIQSDRYKPTLYRKEYEIICKDNVYALDTQDRLGKDRLGKRKGLSFNKNKPFYKKTGEEMRWSQNKWWVIRDDKWLVFEEPDTEIEWK